MSLKNIISPLLKYGQQYIQDYTDEWRDLIIPATGIGKGAASPDRETLNGVVECLAFATGEYVYGAFEIQHDYKEGTDLHVHLHASPLTANTGTFVFDFSYSLAKVGDVFTTATTLSMPQVVSVASNNKHFLVNGGIISGSGIKIGEIIAFRVERQATGNTLAGDVAMFSIGVHYQVDSMGSKSIASKL